MKKIFYPEVWHGADCKYLILPTLSLRVFKI